MPIPRMTVPFNFFQKGRLFADLSRRIVDYPVVSTKFKRQHGRYDNIMRTNCGDHCVRVHAVADHLTGTTSRVRAGGQRPEPMNQPPQQYQAPQYAAPQADGDYPEMMPSDDQPVAPSARRLRW